MNFKSVAVVSCVGLTILASGFVFHGDKTFKANAMINGISVEGQKADESVITYVNDKLDDEVILKWGNESFRFHAKDYGEYGISKDKFSGIDYGLTDYVHGKSYELPVDCRLDVNKLIKLIKKEINPNMQKAINAKIEKKDGSFRIVPEVEGTKLNAKKAAQKISSSNEKMISLNDCIEEPEIQSVDLESDLSEVRKYANWTAEYADGLESEDASGHVEYVNGFKGKKDGIALGCGYVVINETFIDDLVDKEAAKQNSAGGKHVFKDHRGKKLTVSGGTYGSMIDSNKEKEFLHRAFRKGESVVKRKPSFLQKAKTGKDAPNDVGDTYVEVSIDQQHVWFVKNGKVVMDSPAVTGTKGVHDTPKGVFFISEIVNGKYLTGPGYKTWVNKWMRLTNMGVGLHDATWRGSFGGSIYQYSGSHGCINLPYSFASSLFKKVEYGMPVIVH